MAQVPLKMRVLFLIPALLVLDPPITGSSLASQVKVVALSLPSNVARRTSGVNAEAFNARMEAMMKRLYVQEERFIIITSFKIKIRELEKCVFFHVNMVTVITPDTKFPLFWI